MEGETELETPETEAAPIVETEPESTDVSHETEEDEGRPGGADPQAVRARKEYQRRVQAEKRTADIALELAAAKERARVLEEQAAKPAKEPEFTPLQIQAAVDAGKISQVEATQYLVEQSLSKKLAEQQRQAKAEAPLVTARQTLAEYVKAMPDLADERSESNKKAFMHYRDLVDVYGLPDNEATKVAALKATVGDLDTIKARRETRELTRTSARTTVPGSAGGQGGQVNQKPDISKAPAELVAMWDGTGTDTAARERQYKYYLERQAGKK